jgi:hypothetical protein
MDNVQNYKLYRMRQGNLRVSKSMSTLKSQVSLPDPTNIEIRCETEEMWVGGPLVL